MPKWLPQALLILEGCIGSHLPFEALIRPLSLGAHSFSVTRQRSLQREVLIFQLRGKGGPEGPLAEYHRLAQSVLEHTDCVVARGGH